MRGQGSGTWGAPSSSRRSEDGADVEHAVIAFFLERPASEAALGLARSLRDLQPRLPLLRYDRHATETPFSVLVADDS